MSFLKCLIVAAVMSAVLPLFSQITVSVSGQRGNDTLLFRGFDGPKEIENQVRHDLQCCGWFDLVPNGTAVYMITGKSDGDRIVLHIADAAGQPLTSVVGFGKTKEAASGKAVDAVLRHLYKVDGICSSRIAFAVEVGRTMKEIYTCAYDGTDFQRVTDNRGLSLDPVWTPKNRTLIYSFVGPTGTALIEYDFLTKRSRRLASFKGLNAGGTVSPDGSSIALVLSKDNQVDLYIRPLNGKGLKRLTNDKAVEASPCWSPDGSKICYVSNQGSGRPRLHIISAAGGIPQRLTGALGSESVSPSWAKDGKIIYCSRTGNYTVSVLDPVSGLAEKMPRQIFGTVIDKSGDWEAPSWAPDNRHAVCSFRGGLYIVDTWTGRTRQIVGGRSRISVPSWSGLMQ